MHVRDNIGELGKVADDTDLLFLKGLLDSPIVASLAKVSECARCRPDVKANDSDREMLPIVGSGFFRQSDNEIPRQIPGNQ